LKHPGIALEFKILNAFQENMVTLLIDFIANISLETLLLENCLRLHSHTALVTKGMKLHFDKNFFSY